MWNEKKQKITYSQIFAYKRKGMQITAGKVFHRGHFQTIFKPFSMIIVTWNVSLVEIGFLVSPIRSCHSLYQSLATADISWHLCNYDNL